MKRLGYPELHDWIHQAVARGQAVKKWKLQLIEAANPDRMIYSKR